jgi:hypothetical protein
MLPSEFPLLTGRCSPLSLAAMRLRQKITCHRQLSVALFTGSQTASGIHFQGQNCSCRISVKINEGMFNISKFHMICSPTKHQTIFESSPNLKGKYPLFLLFLDLRSIFLISCPNPLKPPKNHPRGTNNFKTPYLVRYRNL